MKGLSDGVTRNSNNLLALPIIMVPLARGQLLVASTIFTALSMADLIGTTISDISSGINALADYYSVIKRVEEVLLL